ncbi:MAG: di-heme oxidoredictase family protein [bacterium]|nr:di-heme oxidoredictase family protein [bacterium]
MNFYTWTMALALALVLTSCDVFAPGAPAPDATLVGPMSELTAEQRQAHLRGDEEFGRVFGRFDGLGPIFVSSSCEGCHAGDGKGHPSTFLTRYGRMTPTGFDPLSSLGGPQLQHLAVYGHVGESIPIEATGVSRLMAPSVAGLGFLEAVDDATILALADRLDANGDGISGIPNYSEPPDFVSPLPAHVPLNGKYIGRFGRKAGTIDLLQQVATAYLQDMGVTSDFFMKDLHNMQSGPITGDDAPDPEVSANIVHRVAFYLRTLRAPERRNASDAAVKNGERHFAAVGCASCHVPTLTTGASTLAPLDRREFHPYTDLLLHDMGPELDDGYTEGTATTSEWRTTPLWGLGLSGASQGGTGFFLHDGRAHTLNDAIMLHGGEGAQSRGLYQALSETERRELLLFLESL